MIDPIEDVSSQESALEAKCYEAAERRPWQTLLRVDDVAPERNLFYVIVPGWDPNTVIRLPISILPEPLRASVQPGARFNAMSNIGAEKADDLYFYDFTIAERPQGKYAQLLRN